MPVLYLRVSDEVAEYVRGVAERSGLSLAKTVEILLHSCEGQGFHTIEVQQVPRAQA